MQDSTLTQTAELSTLTLFLVLNTDINHINSITALFWGLSKEFKILINF